ncbi:MAG: pyruvate kinase [Saprospiraceae bacterium]|nr:pyruvate kinase [Saprospiraceae bacterium]
MRDSIIPLRQSLDQILRKLLAAGRQGDPVVKTVHPDQRVSAVNLLHYLALRREDLRELQDDLHDAGLSSLASSESHVLRQVQSVLQRLGAKIPAEDISICDDETASRLLGQRTRALFGNKLNPHIPHLMVTFDTALAGDYDAVKDLLLAGMSVARINCAHDGPKQWKRMVAHVRKAARVTARPCKVYLDLAGPKIRTVVLGKGRKKGRMKIGEDELFWLSEPKAKVNEQEKVIGCTLPGVVNSLQAGDRVLFDDGLFESVVVKSGVGRAQLRMLRVSARKPFLKPEKGINFPDSRLDIQCLTDFDRAVLPFAKEHADIVGFSFVQKADDVAELQRLLHRDGGAIPLVLKIETFEAVQNLPDLLLQGMKEPVFGVMIARGDLAVEIGFERLSEVQEEILWICEAAHVPVIWATQVLETLNKSGVATRSELTDAARAGHAECVMLNKGKHLLLVLATLRNILLRSGGHHLKKRYIFRPLAIAEHYFNKTGVKKEGGKKKNTP